MKLTDKLFRCWYYLQLGWQVYFGMIFAFINFITLLYYFVLEHDPILKNIFPDFLLFGILSAIVVLFTATLLGYLHIKHGPRKSEYDKLMSQAVKEAAVEYLRFGTVSQRNAAIQNIPGDTLMWSSMLFFPKESQALKQELNSFFDQNFKNVLIDKQMLKYYISRFGNNRGKDISSAVNNTDLDYYPKLLQSVDVVVSP